MNQDRAAPVTPPTGWDLAQFVAGAFLQQDCGDQVVWQCRSDRWRALVFDAVGTGRSTTPVIQRLGPQPLQHSDTDLLEILQQLHDRLQGTAGGAGMLIEATRQPDHWRVSAMGVGNIRGVVQCGSMAHSLTSQPGTLGKRLPRNPRAQHITITHRCTVLVHTDGVNSSAAKHDLNLSDSAYDLCSSIGHTYGRPFDDVGVFVAHYRGEP